MSCVNPLTGYILSFLGCEKKIVTFKDPFKSGSILGSTRDIVSIKKQSFPCGKCPGCIIDRGKLWAARMQCAFEDFKHKAFFLTLTYNEDNCPIFLNKSHLQKFIKRFRKFIFANISKDLKIKYYACGEYGGTSFRPHYHLIIFGFDPFDFFEPINSNKSLTGQKTFNFDFLDKLWPFGFHSVGSFSSQSAAYVARYVTKKFTNYLDYKEIVNNIPDFVPEFSLMSKGLGFDYLLNNWSNIVDLNKGSIYLVGHEFKLSKTLKYICKSKLGLDPDIELKEINNINEITAAANNHLINDININVINSFNAKKRNL